MSCLVVAVESTLTFSSTFFAENCCPFPLQRERVAADKALQQPYNVGPDIRILFWVLVQEVLKFLVAKAGLA